MPPGSDNFETNAPKTEVISSSLPESEIKITCLRNNMALYNGIHLFPESCDTIDKKYGFFSESMPT